MTLAKKRISSMNMSQEKNIPLPIPGVSDAPGVGDARGIVPATPLSSSDVGLSAVVPAGAAPELATAAERVVNKDPALGEPQFTSGEDVAIADAIDMSVDMTTETVENTTQVQSSIIDETSNSTIVDETPKTIIVTEDEKMDSVSQISEDTNLEATQRPPKRMLEKTSDRESQDSDEDISKPKISVRNRRRLTNEGGIQQCTSNPDIIETIAKEELRKVGRPKKKTKAIDPEIAERAVIAKTGIAPEKLEEDLLKGMIASDISAQALEYISDIEIIRVKSGRLQGGLSGELRKRASCLEDMIRALQAKAESKGDPISLKYKIEELLEIRTNKKEEEKRKREIIEMREIIRDLKKENKKMREEMRKIRESVERKGSMDRKRSLERSEGKDSLRKKSNDCQPERKDLPESYGEVPHVQDGAMLSHDGWPVDPEVGWSQSEEVVHL